MCLLKHNIVGGWKVINACRNETNYIARSARDVSFAHAWHAVRQTVFAVVESHSLCIIAIHRYA